METKHDDLPEATEVNIGFAGSDEPLLDRPVTRPPTEEGGPSGEGMGVVPRMTITQWVVTIGLCLAVLGQVLIWIKSSILGSDSMVPSKPCDEGAQQGTQDQLGVYALLLVVIAFANYTAAKFERSQITWISAAVAFSILDLNVCETHWLFQCTPGPSTSASDANVVKAGYTLLLMGTISTFIACPFGRGRGSQRSPDDRTATLELGIGALVVLLLIVGSILLWSKGTPCADSQTGNGGPHSPKYPIYVGRAAYLAVWHGLSLFSGYQDGLELSFIYATISIADYQPFGARCNWNECLAGIIMIFAALILLVIAKVIGSFSGSGRQDSASGVGGGGLREQLAQKRTQVIWAVFSIVLAWVGAIAIWATKDKDGTGKYTGGQEAFDVFSMAFSVVMMFVCLISGNRLFAVIAIGFTYSVINRTLGAFPGAGGSSLGFGTCPPEWVEPTGIIYHAASGIRAGYIMLFISIGLSFVCLLDTSRVIDQIQDLGVSYGDVMREESRVAALVGIVVILCVAYLWSDGRYYGQLGFTALIYMICAVTGPGGRSTFKEGLNFVYFASVLQIPTLTPFTTCEARNSANKLVLLLCLMCLFVIVFQHTTRRGHGATITHASARQTQQQYEQQPPPQTNAPAAWVAE